MHTQTPLRTVPPTTDKKRVAGHLAHATISLRDARREIGPEFPSVLDELENLIRRVEFVADRFAR